VSPARRGRPVGSTSGRIPAGGYPEIDAELGGFLAGFIEGEACFSLPKQPKGQNHRCTMSLCVRADDPRLREGLAAEREAAAAASISLVVSFT
jgi:hypothetical protein